MPSCRSTAFFRTGYNGHSIKILFVVLDLAKQEETKSAKTTNRRAEDGESSARTHENRKSIGKSDKKARKDAELAWELEQFGRKSAALSLVMEPERSILELPDFLQQVLVQLY